ncbi:ABC transporter ATP-binding protein [Streptomyces sp. 549]|uniref:ABC transporter ATP-binding protein n=1 Tax=Streptomyces sp. 549 TaxID=3049076 RepID=UPI0024C39BC3|nr:ABC transporter ATP-binding protein [Streptomyces sp. 549]MDK1476520.1 ABC transporter ATP-binding protein [Streptomyces sp. 549]
MSQARDAEHPPGGRHGRRALVRHLRPQRAGILLGTALGLLGSLVGLVQPLAAKRLVDDLGAGEHAVGLLVALSVLVVLGAGLAALGQYVLERTAEAVVHTARRRLASRLLRLRLSAVERTEPGDLISRATSDTTLLRQVATQSVASAVTGSLVLVATVTLMGVLDVVLLGVTSGALALVAVAVAVVAPRIGRATRQTQEAVGGIGAELERVFGAYRTVKASGAEQYEIARLHEAAGRARRAGVRAARWEALSNSSGVVAVQTAFLLVLGVGGARVASGAMSVSTLVAFLLYLFSLAPRIHQLVDCVAQLQTGMTAAARIQDVEDLPVEHSRPANETSQPGQPTRRPEDARVPGAPPADGVPPPPDARPPAAVTFDSVSFAYRAGLPAVHREVSFTVPALGMTAFVGPSGAGKTTVFSLIERFHEPDAGRVLLDGRDVRQWPLDELRASIGYVEQDAPVLAGTLRENLLFGLLSVTEERLHHTLRQARLDTVVARLPDGLDTPVGHRGGSLSGGERQRVAIARALLRSPRLLLLDEATSQLDAANEAVLRETVAEAARSTTVLVVAHRLSTVTTADRIVVMDGGRVSAVGTHAELLACDGLYRRLAATQFLAADRLSPAAPARPDTG